MSQLLPPPHEDIDSEVDHHFLLLPLEIRLRVYSYIFRDACITVFHGHTYSDHMNTHTLRVCKQIYQEASPVLASSIELVFTGDDVAIEDIPQSVRTSYLPSIEKLKLCRAQPTAHDFHVEVQELTSLKSLWIAHDMPTQERQIDIGVKASSRDLVGPLLGDDDESLPQQWFEEQRKSESTSLHSLMLSPIPNRPYNLYLDIVTKVQVLGEEGGKRRAEVLLNINVDTKQIMYRSVCYHFHEHLIDELSALLNTKADIKTWLNLKCDQSDDCLFID